MSEFHFDKPKRMKLSGFKSAIFAYFLSQDTKSKSHQPPKASGEMVLTLNAIIKKTEYLSAKLAAKCL